MLFESVGGRRFTQDSPLLPDVWMAYAEDPGSPQDLLLIPHRDARTGQAAQELRTGINAMRARLLTAKAGAGNRREEVRIAHMPGVIVAKLYFDELIRLVLPRTAWWQLQTRSASKGLGSGASGDLFPMSDATVKELGARLDKLGKGPQTAGSVTPKNEVPPDFLWIASLTGRMAMEIGPPVQRNEEDGQTAGDHGGLAQAKAFANIFSGWPAKEDQVSPAGATMLWRVTLNRRTEAAITQSALAVKADAARLLFNVSCKQIVWAVVDSGIQADHPAFRDWGASEENSSMSRVIRTYDFTRVRDLLDPVSIGRIFQARKLNGDEATLKRRLIDNLVFLGVADPQTTAPRHVKQLKERVERGIDIDWALLEPFLLIQTPETPANPHGTHVAGILGADWRIEKPAANGGTAAQETLMQGICPDIRLIDVRVLGRDGRSDEFEVIAALQFLRYLNSRADAPFIHGANLSLSTPHVVTAYACGSTPICEECDRLWNSGVVLVAAAGNNGHRSYVTTDGNTLGGYNSISITDPGNAEGVITVGATHRVRPHQYGVSYFSSRGPTGDGRRKPDIVAPGEKIDAPSTYEGIATGDGTSLAAPHVSGAAAMLMARHNELIGRPVKIKKILCDTATDLGREPYFQGAGMLDILRALQSV
jgi:subtilisin family serine protease